ncbi:hypothetical protein D3C78_925170 [compost metagenome]
MLILHLIIHGEDLVLFILRNAHAGVFHFKHQPILLFTPHPHHDLPLRGKLHRVADQVPQDLPQAGAIGDDLLRQRLLRLHHKLQPFRLHQQAGEVFQIGQEAGKVHRLIVELHFTALEFVHLDNVIEDITQRDGADMDGFEVFQLFVV